MLDVYKRSIANQFESALCMLNACIERCPDSLWEVKVGNLAFCQVAFHALFFTDVYLGQGVESLRGQAFHQENAEFFRDYEELEPREQALMYDRSFIARYLEHCRRKAGEAIAAETAESLGRQPGFTWLKFSRAEVYLYNLRHIQHHVAQLSLRLRLDAKVEVTWVGSGWKDL